ncbi:MAG TPA: hypothetical protein VL688_01975 [Verrucomicrobiae bacterium]|nr:hypothetical protein [Verrucomicrobiae bacterium]
MNPNPQSVQGPSARERRVLACTGAALAVFALLKYAARFIPLEMTKFDDAYMFLRYAHNLLEGHGLRWNAAGPMTYGTTSLLYLLEVTASVFLSPLPGYKTLLLVSAANGLAAFFMITFAACRAVRSPWLKNFPLLCGINGMLLLAEENFRAQAATGMDTTLSIFINALLVLCVLRLWDAPSRAGAMLTAAVSYLSVLCRPDHFFYAGLFPLLAFWILDMERKKEITLVWAVTLAGLAAADSAAKWALFGDIMPLPVYVKAKGFYEGFYGAYDLNPVRLFNYFLVTCAPFLAAGFLFFRRKFFKTAVVFGVPVLISYAALFLAHPIMGWRGRFYFPGLPFIVISVYLALDGALRDRDFRRENFVGYFLRATALFFIMLAMPSWYSRSEEMFHGWLRSKAPGHYDVELRTYLSEGKIRDLPWWDSILAMDEMLDRIPGPFVLAATEHGLLSSRHPEDTIIDMNGLHDPQIAKNKFSAEYVFSREPDLIWFPFWDYTGSVRALWNSDRLWKDYEYFPRAFNYGIAIRKGSPKYREIREAVKAEWQKTYPGSDFEEERAASPEILQRRISDFMAALKSSPQSPR